MDSVIDDSAASNSDMEWAPVIDDSASESASETSPLSTLFNVDSDSEDDDDVEMDGAGTRSNPINLGERTSLTKRKSSPNLKQKAAKRRREKARRVALREKENSLENHIRLFLLDNYQLNMLFVEK